MGLFKSCCVCCACLSVWAVIQLTFMGYFFYIETPILIHEAEDHHETDYDKFIAQTEKNYAANAVNCWIAAAAYGLTLILSCCCVCAANRKEKEKLKAMEDDEVVCAPKEPPKPQEVSSALAAGKIKKSKLKADDKHSDDEKKKSPKVKTKKAKESEGEPLPMKEKK